MELANTEKLKHLYDIRAPIAYLGIRDDPVIPTLKVVFLYLQLVQSSKVEQSIATLAQHQSQGLRLNADFHYQMGPLPPFFENGPGMGVWLKTPKKSEFSFFIPYETNEDLYESMIARGCFFITSLHNRVGLPIYIRTYELFAYVEEWSTTKT